MMFEHQIPMSRSDQVAGFLDQELIDELKRRGYRVAKPECIRTYGAEVRHSAAHLARVSAVDRFEQHLMRDISSALAAELFRTGAVEVSKEAGGNETVYRAVLTLLAPLKA